MKKLITSAASIITFLLIQASFVPDGPTSKEGLGELLFFDPILSKDKSISCASCHKPACAFADTSATSLGVAGIIGFRNTPTAMNTLTQKIFFWDGRAATLEQQALAPIENPLEMNLPLEQALKRLRNNKRYRIYFDRIFNSAPTSANLALSIAAFERTLETSESPFDIWKYYDDSTKVSDAVKRGFGLFNEKGKCSQCHFGSNFTLDEFRNIGLFNGKDLNDSGRSVISLNINDVGKFKIPSLRNIAITAPYMHNGIFRTLKEVINFYDDPGKVVTNSINRDSLLIRPLGLTSEEKNDLEAFLMSLTDKRFNKKDN